MLSLPRVGVHVLCRGDNRISSQLITQAAPRSVGGDATANLGTGKPVIKY